MGMIIAFGVDNERTKLLIFRMKPLQLCYNQSQFLYGINTRQLRIRQSNAINWLKAMRITNRTDQRQLQDQVELIRSDKDNVKLCENEIII